MPADVAASLFRELPRLAKAVQQVRYCASNSVLIH